MGYLCLMADIFFSKHALAEYRQDFRSMTQEQLAKCCGISQKSIARLEDPKTDNKMSEDKMAAIADCLQIPQYKLWDDIPSEVNFVGVALSTEMDLSRIIFSDTTLVDFDVQSLPDSDKAQNGLLTIAEIVDNEWSRRQANLSQSAHEKLNGKIKLSKAFSETAFFTGTFYTISICYFDNYEFDSLIGSEQVGFSYAGYMCWKIETKLIYKAWHNGESPSPPSLLCPIFREGNSVRSCPSDEERRKELLLWGRGDEICPT